MNNEYHVGIVDDERCEYHLQYKGHKESPDRVIIIRKQLKKENLYQKLIKIKPNDTTKKDLMLVHTFKYINRVIRICKDYQHAILNTNVRVSGKNSLISSMVAVGSVLAATEAVILSDNIRKVFCNIRPPGHQAIVSKSANECIFNNVAIGVKKALMYKEINKVLIVDWGLRSGDGTMSIFKNNKNVMYASLHRDYSENVKPINEDKYENVYNFPQSKNFTVKEYMHDFNDYLLPQIGKFNPDIIFISCGFDGHVDDLYRDLQLTYNHYKIMTKSLCDIANEMCEGRIVSVLEGGYSLDVLGNCASVHIREMMNNKL